MQQIDGLESTSRGIVKTWSPRRGRLLKLAAALVLATGFGAVSTAAAFAKTKVRKIPANFVYIGHVTDGRCLWGIGIEFPSVPKATSYGLTYFDGYYGHWEAGGATVPVAKTPGMTKGMNYFGITGGGGPAPCGTDATEGGRFTKPIKAYAYFAGKEPSTGAIEGVVTNADGNPVQGAKVTAYGPSHETAESGPGGIYYMDVEAGHYRVVPDDTSLKKSSFTPTDVSVSVKKDENATADFKLDSGLQLTMNLSSTSVAASGYSIVTGTITTMQYGKPAPGINVKLSVDPTDPGAALTTAPKVAICGTSGRIWPTGSITDLDGNDITVTTDSNGRYQFSLTVGTVPGTWQLDAWAFNDDGKLSTDVGNASETTSLGVAALPTQTATPIGTFVTELGWVKSTSYSSALSANPGSLSQLLSTLAANAVQFGGLTFSVGQGTDGQNLIVAPAGSPFVIGSSGQVQQSSSLLNDLVIDPQEWTGAGLPSTAVSPASLQYALQNAFVSNVPTINQWQSGASGVTGWNLTSSNTLSDPSSSLQYFGWAYPPVSSTPGYCS